MNASGATPPTSLLVKDVLHLREACEGTERSWMTAYSHYNVTVVMTIFKLQPLQSPHFVWANLMAPHHRYDQRWLTSTVDFYMVSSHELYMFLIAGCRRRQCASSQLWASIISFIGQVREPTLRTQSGPGSIQRCL